MTTIITYEIWSEPEYQNGYIIGWNKITPYKHELDSEEDKELIDDLLINLAEKDDAHNVLVNGYKVLISK